LSSLSSSSSLAPTTSSTVAATTTSHDVWSLGERARKQRGVIIKIEGRGRGKWRAPWWFFIWPALQK
jgi:hypothetical protein